MKRQFLKSSESSLGAAYLLSKEIASGPIVRLFLSETSIKASGCSLNTLCRATLNKFNPNCYSVTASRYSCASTVLAFSFNRCGAVFRFTIVKDSLGGGPRRGIFGRGVELMDRDRSVPPLR